MLHFIFLLGTPGSGAYNVVSHMIETSAHRIKEIDPEILKKKPPFNIKEERFSPLQKENESYKLLKTKFY